MEKDQIKSSLEAILYVAGDGVPMEHLASVFDITVLEMNSIISEMIDDYNYNRRGLQILNIDGNVQFSTRAEYADLVTRALAPVKSHTLSAAAIETLSIIAYMQPITRSEIEHIRGVRCEYVVSMLHKRGMIYISGYKDMVGRPAQYSTTREFLKWFGITSINDLPPITEETDSVEEFDTI